MPLTETRVQTVSNEEEILSCIDRALDSMGHNVRNVVYWHLKRMGHVSKIEIPGKPMAFVQGLRDIYAESSPGVEKAILHELNRTFDMEYSNRQDLVSAIFQAKNKQ